MQKLLIAIFCFTSFSVFSQNPMDIGRFSGNFNIEAQAYTKDTIIGAEEVPESIRSNSFLNLIYYLGDFEAGIRYEAYLPPLLGYDADYEGSGIAYRYITYRSDLIEITGGDFYEQFGSGLIFRAYEEKALGIDNAVDGVRFKLFPADGIELTGLLGNQRSYWGKSEGIVRAGDANINLNSLLPESMPEELGITIGGSVVSKFQADNETTYNLPENVLAYSGRLLLNGYTYSFEGEYAYKYNDPNATNQFSFNPGQGIILSGSYFDMGIGISLNTHWIDNMDFRSDRGAIINDLNMSFVPPLTKQHVYRMTTLYPFGSQLNGEAGYQAEITYKFEKNTFLGGDYGTTFNVNYSEVYSIDTTFIDSETYESRFLGIGDDLYFSDANFSVSHRWSPDFKTNIFLMHSTYDRDVLEEGGTPIFGKVTSNAAVFEFTYRLSEDHAIRTELQNLWSEQDSTQHEPDNRNGDWAMVLVEYTIAPTYYITVWDEYNYGNEFEERRLHYPGVSLAFILGATRVALGYGRQRGGLICVGGVCRSVPASNGFSFNVSSSF